MQSLSLSFVGHRCTSLVLLILLLSTMPSASAGQQWTVSVPPLSFMATGPSIGPATAAEAAAHTRAEFQGAFARIFSARRGALGMDSIRKTVAMASATWLMRLQQAPPVGRQLDPSAEVGLAADQVPYAQRQIAARLATPGLSLQERAYTLSTAAIAFTDVYLPDRLPIAEQYVQQLDALGDSAATWQYEAHRALVKTYYLLGRSPDIVRHGTRTIELLGRMPYPNRTVFYWQTDDEVYSPTVEALAGQPQGGHQIERLSRMVRTFTIPAPEVVAVDSGYTWFQSRFQSVVVRWIAGNAKIGTSAAPLPAHYWANRPSSDSATLTFADGKIRIIEVAHTGCPGCVWELHALQRLHDRYPDIEPILYTWTFGYWANRLIDPAEEIRRLVQYFVADTKITYPVGIWAGKKVQNEDDGMTPEPSPALADYPLMGKPMCWVIDGHGKIRRVFTGYSTEIEQQMIRTIEFLRREVPSVSAR